MNPIIRFALKISSMPLLDMTRHYKFIRKLQNLGAREEKPKDFILFDEEIRMEGCDHAIPVRVFTQGELESNGTIIFFHGGGYTIGNVDSYTAACVQLAKHTKMQVLSVDYRLAPEHPFPAGLDDCYTAMRFFLDDNDNRFRPLFVMGDSAGANLATVCCYLSKEEDKAQPDGQILLYPAVGWDYSETSPFPSMHTKAEGYGLTRKKVYEFYSLYVQDRDPKQPEIAPLLMPSVEGLPPSLLLTAEHDPLRDEGTMYGAKLYHAGVPSEVYQIREVPHGFWTHERPFERAIKQVYEILVPWIEAHR